MDHLVFARAVTASQGEIFHVKAVVSSRHQVVAAKPSKGNLTAGSLKAFQVSLVEPVVYLST
jgi:hypothetical protein